VGDWIHYLGFALFVLAFVGMRLPPFFWFLALIGAAKFSPRRLVNRSGVAAATRRFLRFRCSSPCTERNPTCVKMSKAFSSRTTQQITKSFLRRTKKMTPHWILFEKLPPATPKSIAASL